MNDDKGERLWTWLRGLYGRGLELEFGAFMPQAWRVAVARMTDEDLRRGCLALRNGGSRYPPKLPEFLAMCRVEKVEPAHRALTAAKVQALPRTEAGRQAALKAGALAHELLEQHGNDDIAAARAAIADQHTPQANALRADLARFERARAASAWRRG